jgi:hypothetical protein
MGWALDDEVYQERKPMRRHVQLEERVIDRGGSPAKLAQHHLDGGSGGLVGGFTHPFVPLLIEVTGGPVIVPHADSMY